jgi:hypothetical protein
VLRGTRCSALTISPWNLLPITWRNRRSGIAKLKIAEMGSRYFFIVMYVWLEKYFSRGDYRRQPVQSGNSENVPSVTVTAADVGTTQP